MEGKEYKPNAEDILWATNVLYLSREDGMVIFPSTGLAYAVSHKLRTLTLQNPSSLLDSDALEVHRKSKVVFAVLGYDVKSVGGIG